MVRRSVHGRVLYFGKCWPPSRNGGSLHVPRRCFGVRIGFSCRGEGAHSSREENRSGGYWRSRNRRFGPFHCFWRDVFLVSIVGWRGIQRAFHGFLGALLGRRVLQAGNEEHHSILSRRLCDGDCFGRSASFHDSHRIVPFVCNYADCFGGSVCVGRSVVERLCFARFGEVRRGEAGNVHVALSRRSASSWLDSDISSI